MKNLCIIVLVILCVSFTPTSNKAEVNQPIKIDTNNIKLEPIVEKLSTIDSLLKVISNEKKIK